VGLDQKKFGRVEDEVADYLKTSSLRPRLDTRRIL